MFRFKYYFISHITRGIKNTHLLAARDKHFISIQQYVPAMHPGKRSTLAFCQSDSLIQLPSWLFTPPAGMGMVSLWLFVTITVLLSTRATSFGSVRANQLKKKNRVGIRNEIQSFAGLKTIHQRRHVFCASPYQFSYLGSLLTIPSFSRPARMFAVSSGVPVTTCTLAGLHSSTAPFTKSATAGGSEGMEAKDRTPTLAPTPPCLKENRF